MSSLNKKEKASKGELLSAVKRVFKYEIHYYPIAFFASFVCMIISAVCNVFSTIFIGIVVDGPISSMLDQAQNGLEVDYWPLTQLTIILAAILFVCLVSMYLYSYLMAYVAQGTQKHIRDDLFNHMQDLPVSFFDRHTRGDIMSIYTNDVDTLREALSRSWPALVNSVSTLLVVVVTMFVQNWILALITIAMSIPTIFIAKAIASRSSRYFIAYQKSLGRTNGYVEEMMNGQRVVKVFNYEEESIRKFDEINDRLCDESIKANRYANIMLPAVNQIGNVQYILLAIIGSLLYYFIGTSQGIIDSNETPVIFLGASFSIGTILSSIMLSRSYTSPIGQMAQQTNSIVMAFAGMVRIFALLDEPIETDDGYVELVNAKEGPDGNPVEVVERTGRWAWKHPHQDGSQTTYTWLQGKINFYDVDFGYNPEKIVLHNITLYAEPGQKVAFVGPTGAGKTTITNLINRFYDIADGKIRYDDININKIKKADLRRSLGMVLQETELFTGTVKENIRFGKLDATDEEVIAAAKLANADRFISQLPQGYDTVLTKAGTNLSQGQRQLIAIARCAIANPPVMILDEATSSIDSRTEELVQQGMDAIMKGRTTFVIAHRLSTVKNSDVIMVIDQGRIIERGSHDELLAKQGKYWQLYTGGQVTAK